MGEIKSFAEGVKDVRAHVFHTGGCIKAAAWFSIIREEPFDRIIIAVKVEDIAKFELEQLTGLYKFYLDAYIKGIAFFLAASFVAKTALASMQHRRAISLAGMATSIPVHVPLIFPAWHERTFREQFRHLAERTSTTRISTAPLRVLIVGTSGLWLVLFVA